jgi:NTP pyrophosphatase (non-canonical NTP hydrolase)
MDKPRALGKEHSRTVTRSAEVEHGHDMVPLTKLMTEVDGWIRTTGVRYFDPLTNMAMLAEEVGEVARIMARRYGEQSEKESDKAKDLGEELADVLFVVLCLANQTGTDLQAAWESRMAKKTIRDKERHRNNPKLT